MIITVRRGKLHIVGDSEFFVISDSRLKGSKEVRFDFEIKI